MIRKAYREKRSEIRAEEPMTKGRTVLLSVRIFLLALFQVSVVSRLGLFGAVPDMLLCYIVVLAVTGRGGSGWRTLALSGLILGFLCDAIGGVGVSLLGLFYFLVGALLPGLSRRDRGGALYELLLSYIFLIPVAVLRTGITLLSTFFVQTGGFSLQICMRSVLLPELFGTLVLMFPVFLIFRGREY